MLKLNCVFVVLYTFTLIFCAECNVHFGLDPLGDHSASSLAGYMLCIHAL